MAVQPNTLDLTTLAAVQLYLGSAAAANNDPIQTLITAISAWVMKFCNRDFRKADYVEVRNGRGQDQMFTRYTPINTVAGVSIDGVVLPVASGSPPTAGYAFDSDSIYVFPPYSFTRNKQNTTISYNAGWVTPGMATGSSPPAVTLPQDLQQAIVESVADRFKRRDSIGVLSKTLAGEVITYSQADLPKSAAPVIDAYRVLGYPV